LFKWGKEPHSKIWVNVGLDLGKIPTWDALEFV
jgi:hypothetical protein